MLSGRPLLPSCAVDAAALLPMNELVGCGITVGACGGADTSALSTSIGAAAVPLPLPLPTLAPAGVQATDCCLYVPATALHLYAEREETPTKAGSAPGAAGAGLALKSVLGPDPAEPPADGELESWLAAWGRLAAAQGCAVPPPAPSPGHSFALAAAPPAGHPRSAALTAIHICAPCPTHASTNVPGVRKLAPQFCHHPSYGGPAHSAPSLTHPNCRPLDGCLQYNST